eukprot:552221-Rhodomonas_salina.1
MEASWSDFLWFANSCLRRRQVLISNPFNPKPQSRKPKAESRKPKAESRKPNRLDEAPDLALSAEADLAFAFSAGSCLLRRCPVYGTDPSPRDWY